MQIASFLFIGTGEILVIMVVTVLVFGPKKIPEIARGFGQAVRAMRNATDDIKREILDAAEADETVKSVKNTQQEVQQQIDEAKKSIDDAVGPIQRNM